MGFFDFLKNKTEKSTSSNQDGDIKEVMTCIKKETLNNFKIKSMARDEDSFLDNSSVNQVLITSPYEPTIDLQSREGVNNYLEKVSNYSSLELSIELSNVLSAKYNKMVLPSSTDTFADTQKVVTDLTDKALLLCYVAFGMEEVLNYCSQDTRVFNQLINDIDEQVAQLNFAPAAHGKKVFDLIYKKMIEQL